MARKKQVVTEEEKLSRALEGARAALSEKGVASGTKLGPPKLRAQVVQVLIGEGFEKAGAKVRRPIKDQLSELLQTGAHLPLATLAKRLQGVTGPEAKKAAESLVRLKAAHLVLRGAQLSLVPYTEAALELEHLPEVVKTANQLLAWLKKAKSNKLPVTILASDFFERIDELKLQALRDSGGTQGETLGGGELISSPTGVSDGQALRGALLALRDEDSGLISIPAVSRRLRERLSEEQVKSLLLEAYRGGELELRPEGGIGRLSEEEAGLCPLGAGGIPLSWARLVEVNS